MSQTKHTPGPRALDALRSLLESGQFHHATYRCQGTLWEGLWFYRRDADGFRGYSVAGGVTLATDGKADVDAAIDACKGTGISLGAYGEG